MYFIEITVTRLGGLRLRRTRTCAQAPQAPQAPRPRQLTVEAGFGISLAVVGWYSSTCKGESFTAPTRVAKRSARNMAQNDTRAPPRPLPHETHLPRSGRVAPSPCASLGGLTHRRELSRIRTHPPTASTGYRPPCRVVRIAGPSCPRVSSPRAAVRPMSPLPASH